MTRLFGIIKTGPARLSQVCLLAFSMACLAAPGAAVAGDEPGYLTRALGMRTTVPEAPDFVMKSRKPDQDFIPVHAPRPKPAGQPMAKEEVAKKEKALDSARKKQDKLAGRASAPIGKSVAEDMTSRDAKAEAKRPTCGLTCPSPGLLPSITGKEAR